MTDTLDQVRKELLAGEVEYLRNIRHDIQRATLILRATSERLDAIAKNIEAQAGSGVSRSCTSDHAQKRAGGLAER